MAYYIVTVTEKSTGKLKAVLTTEGYLKFQKMMQYHGRKERGGGEHGRQRNPNQTLKPSYLLSASFPK